MRKGLLYLALVKAIRVTGRRLSPQTFREVKRRLEAAGFEASHAEVRTLPIIGPIAAPIPADRGRGA
jgi:hypothetical protein